MVDLHVIVFDADGNGVLGLPGPATPTRRRR
jgi:hypothetical protein